jgi:CcmD family protein
MSALAGSVIFPIAAAAGKGAVQVVAVKSQLAAFMVAPLICWIAIFLYLWRLDARVRGLKK